ncbi:hypothetical protein KSC_054450 [Ktedonobacter sp. SOSP1-52]|uniref:hypothetical protein n=1 Tax=Ktedonobacter sp. SOSP1-52 TaxID=2778366 RepID=UPI00191688E7|nr:hypothetical protein [Ktedonobacter sp. SOSP1-52]GHO66553.1 hypothetical protein KSC_054450 [Ktedonobacter sp. SOSP1-52]
MTTIHISREHARRFLTSYHFRPTDLAGVFERLGTVQYDPLNPVGRNPDLVFQARISGYQVDGWQHAAYTQRMVYDAWDKQSFPPKYRATNPSSPSIVSGSTQSA